MSQAQWLSQWPNVPAPTNAAVLLQQQLGSDPDWATPAHISQVSKRLGDAGLALLVIDSNSPAASEAQFEQRLDECARAAELLGVPSASDIHLNQLPSALEALQPHDKRGRLRRRLRHMVSERARSAAFYDLISHGLGSGGAPDLEATQIAGQLMDASHASLRDDFEATAPQTDLAVATAHGAGAFGARMLGDGFGGTVLALVPIAEVESIAEAVVHGFASVGFTPPAFYLVS